jgi:hypothetical protein
MISPEEIDDIFDIGELNGSEVKVIKTIGGFYAATSKNNGKDIVLAGGSHPALVRHALKKKFGNSFKASLLKSENSQLNAQVIEKTSFLSKNQIDKGYSMNVIVDSEDIKMVIDHHGVAILEQSALAKSDSLEIQGLSVLNTQKSSILFNEGIAKSLLKAFAGTAKDLKIPNLSYMEQPKLVKIDDILKGK